MSDKQLMLLSTLEDIKFSIELIQIRFQGITHFDVDAETIFYVCKDHLSKLLEATVHMIEKVNPNC